MNTEERLRRKVNAVFNTSPRIGIDDRMVWLERPGAMRGLREAFDKSNLVCLDGPSGAGKTSLALTYLHKHEVRHAAVQLTASMTWPEFCRQIISKPSNEEVSFSGEIDTGIDKGLPTLKFRVSLGAKGRKSDDVDLITKLSSSWTEADVARCMVEERTALLVDDLERANDELVNRLSDLSKLLTQSFVHESAMLFFVGTGDVYRKLCRANKSLDDRLVETSLGTFRSPHDSWRFMTLGLDKLRLRNPQNSIIATERDQARVCGEAVWEAADGLPKSLNLLGRTIALKAVAAGRRAVSAHDIRTASETMTNDHWISYGRDFPAVLQFLEGSEIGRWLVCCLYEMGIGRVHRFSELVLKVGAASQKLCRAVPAGEIEDTVNELVSLGFLVRTGRGEEVIFPADPTAAHTLGVVMRDQVRFKTIAELLREPEQMMLAFPRQLDGDPEWSEDGSYGQLAWHAATPAPDGWRRR